MASLARRQANISVFAKQGAASHLLIHRTAHRCTEPSQHESPPSQASQVAGRFLAVLITGLELCRSKEIRPIFLSSFGISSWPYPFLCAPVPQIRPAWKSINRKRSSFFVLRFGPYHIPYRTGRANRPQAGVPVSPIAQSRKRAHLASVPHNTSRTRREVASGPTASVSQAPRHQYIFHPSRTEHLYFHCVGSVGRVAIGPIEALILDRIGLPE